MSVCGPFLSPRETGRPQREARGKPFRLGFPLDPFPKRPEGRGCGPFLWNPSPERQRKEKQGVSTSTLGGKSRYNLRLEDRMIAKVQRTWMRPGGFYPVVAISRSHPQTCPHGQVWTKSVFLLDRARPVFFGKTKENGGCKLHAASLRRTPL